MTNFTVLYDACVLYPAWLRDLLVELALTGLFRAKWTAAIHEEWVKSLLRDRPQIERASIERVVFLMNKSVPNALVSGYDQLTPGLSLPDPGDRHVMAAAIHCGAQEIVTFNLKDFPEAALQPHGIKACHPDEFVEHLLDLDTEAICEAFRRIRRRLRNPPYTVEAMLSKYEQCGLAVSASILRTYANAL